MIYLLLSSALCFAGPPDWVKGGVPEGRCFEYFKGVGEASSLVEARKRALGAALSEIAMSYRVIISAEARHILKEQGQEIKSKFMEDILTKGESELIEGLKVVEEYKVSSKAGYTYWVLVRVPKVTFWKRCVRRGYGFAPVWRSILIPGWGQFYKGHKSKGWIFLISEGILTSITVYAYLSADYEDRMASQALYQTTADYHKDRARNFRRLGLIFGISALGTYAYNIFDVIASPGKKLYAIEVNLYPLVLCLKF